MQHVKCKHVDCLTYGTLLEQANGGFCGKWCPNCGAHKLNKCDKWRYPKIAQIK